MAQRIPLETVTQFVVETITANGGSMPHNDLAPLMVANGYTTFITRLWDMNQSGAIKTTVKAQPNGKPIVIYTVG